MTNLLLLLLTSSSSRRSRRRDHNIQNVIDELNTKSRRCIILITKGMKQRKSPAKKRKWDKTGQIAFDMILKKFDE